MDLYNWDLDNMIPKGTSHTLVPNSTYEVPKGTIKTRFEPSLPRMPARKNINLLTQDWTGVSYIRCKYFDIGPASQISKLPTKLLMRRGNKSAKPVSDRQEWQSLVVLNGTNIDLWESLVSCFSGPVTKYLLLRQVSWVQIQGVIFFPWEPRFKSGFHNSFWDLVVPDRISWMALEIYKWNLVMSFGLFLFGIT